MLLLEAPRKKKSCFISISRLADMIEKEMRKLFSIPDAKETRLWNRYMTNTFEPLNKPDSTIQDAGLYQGQVGMFQVFIFPCFKCFSPRGCRPLLQTVIML